MKFPALGTSCALGLLITALLASPSPCADEITGTIKAPVQSSGSVAAAWIELPRLLGQSAPVDLSQLSVEVWPDTPDRSDSTASLREAGKGFYQILWRVPRANSEYPLGSVREFHFCIKKEPAAPNVESLRANLIENGDFSHLRENGIPLGVARFEGMKLVPLPEGGNAVAFDADETGHGPVFNTPVFSLVGGESYEVSFRYKVEDAQAHPLYNLTFFSWFNFQDAEGQTLAKERKLIVKTEASDSGDWTQVDTVIAAPANASRGWLDLRNGSTQPFSVMVADIRITPTNIPNAEVLEKTADSGGRPAPTVVRRFDFGLADGGAWSDFTPVSPRDLYRAERGWGFSKLTGEKAVDSRRPEGLGRDFITAANAEFRVDLPDGEYLAWFLIGDAGPQGGAIQNYFFDQYLEANKHILHEENPLPSKHIPEKKFVHYRDFWLPGMDYYDTFVRAKFHQKTATVRVTDGTLRIRWRNLPLAAVMLMPAEHKTAFHADIDRIERERRRDTRITEDSPPANTTPLQPTAAESHRGFVLFRKAASERLYPADIPVAAERLDGLEAFATPGQIESVWFSLHALKDGEPVSIQVSNLQDGDNVIDASRLDVRVARYIFRDTNDRKRVNPDYRFQISALPLDKREELPLVGGFNWTWCVEIGVPEDARAGIYRGNISITTSQGGELASLPLSLRVLPFHLEPLPILQGYYYFPMEPWYAAFWGGNVHGARVLDDPAILDLIRRNERREFEFMKSLGLNTVSITDDLRGDLVYDDGEVRLRPNDRLSFWMDLYKEAGFAPMPWFGFNPIGAATGPLNRLSWLDDSLKPPHTEHWHKAYRSLVRNVSNHAREQGWPEILFYVSDELSNYGRQGAELGVELAKSLRQVDGIRTISSMNGPFERIVVPHVDIAAPNFAFPLGDDIFAFMDESQTEFWIYNAGSQRVTLGLWTWRMGVKGRLQWHYRSMVTDPWDDPGGGRLSNYVISYPGPNGPLPTVNSDVVRAAITDHRYMATLEKAVERRKDDPQYARQVSLAREFMANLKNRLPADVRLLMQQTVDAKEAGGDLSGEFANSDAVTRIRWAIAQLILDLQ